MHRGHGFEFTGLRDLGEVSEFEVSLFTGLIGFGVEASLWLCPLGRLDKADIAAFTTWTNGGLIPHAKHGGNGVLAFAVPGSKLDGTGFEKEQIGHIQVALGSRAGAGEGAACRTGVPYRVGGVEGDVLLGVA